MYERTLESILEGRKDRELAEKQLTDNRKFYRGYNPSENFAILIRAEDEKDALEIAVGYGEDSDFENDWEITDGDLNTYSDCDILIQDPKYDRQLNSCIDI